MHKMQIAIVVWCSVVLLGVFCSIGECGHDESTNWQSGKQDHGLCLSVRLCETEVDQGDPIQVMIALKNTGEVTREIPRTKVGQKLTFQVQNSEGEMASLTERGKIEKTLESSSTRIELAPPSPDGHMFGSALEPGASAVYQIQLSTVYDMSRPGRYKVRAEMVIGNGHQIASGWATIKRKRGKVVRIPSEISRWRRVKRHAMGTKMWLKYGRKRKEPPLSSAEKKRIEYYKKFKLKFEIRLLWNGLSYIRWERQNPDPIRDDWAIDRMFKLMELTGKRYDEDMRKWKFLLLSRAVQLMKKNISEGQPIQALKFSGTGKTQSNPGWLLRQATGADIGREPEKWRMYLKNYEGELILPPPPAAFAMSYNQPQKTQVTVTSEESLNAWSWRIIYFVRRLVKGKDIAQNLPAVGKPGTPAKKTITQTQLGKLFEEGKKEKVKLLLLREIVQVWEVADYTRRRCRLFFKWLTDKDIREKKARVGIRREIKEELENGD